MKKYFYISGLVIICIILSVFIYKNTRPTLVPIDFTPVNVKTTEKTTTIEKDKTYTDANLKYSIDYPATWIIENYTPDDPNYSIRIHPVNPDLLYGMPAEYIDIRSETNSLQTARQIAASGVGGNDMVESKITFAGQTAFFYSHPDYPTSPEETTPSIIFRGIILEHNGKVISIYTHKYQLPEVKKALESFRFIK